MPWGRKGRRGGRRGLSRTKPRSIPRSRRRIRVRSSLEPPVVGVVFGSRISTTYLRDSALLLRGFFAYADSPHPDTIDLFWLRLRCAKALRLGVSFFRFGVLAWPAALPRFKEIDQAI